MDKIISNNGEVAVFSNGDRSPRGSINPSIGYSKIVSLNDFKIVFAVGLTLDDVKRNLARPLSSTDGIPLGTVFKSPLQPSLTLASSINKAILDRDLAEANREDESEEVSK